MTNLPPKAQKVLVYVIVLLPYFGLGMLSVRVAGEPARTTKQLQVDCAFYGDLASAPLPPNASELGRRIISDAAKSYGKRGCDRVAGPLPTPTSAPTPAPTSTPAP